MSEAKKLRAAQDAAMQKQVDGLKQEINAIAMPPIPFIGEDGRIKLRHSDGSVTDVASA